MTEIGLIEKDCEPPQLPSMEGLGSVISKISSLCEPGLAQELEIFYENVFNNPELLGGIFFETNPLDFQTILVIPFSHQNNGYTESLVLVSEPNKKLEYEVSTGVVWNRIEEYYPEMISCIRRGIYPHNPAHSDQHVARILKQDSIYSEIMRVASKMSNMDVF